MSFYENLVMQTQMNYSRFHQRRTVGDTSLPFFIQHSTPRFGGLTWILTGC